MTNLTDASSAPWFTNPPIASITKEIYLPCETKGRAPMAFQRYNGPGLERYEVQGIEVRSDVPEGRRFRTSPDNGRTWSAFTDLVAIPEICAGQEILNHRLDGTYDPASNALIGIFLRQIETKTLWNNYTYADLSRDGGRTWIQQQPLRYEPGESFDPAHPLKPEFLLHNQGYPGNSILFHSNGSRILFLCMANTSDDPKNATRMFKYGAVCMIGHWDAKAGDYRWLAGGRFSIKPTQSGRGTLEPEAIELSGGHILVVFRAATDSWDGSKEVTEPGRKWFSISTDAGQTFSPLAPWGYDDGTLFYSSSSYHRMLRHSVNKKLYWLGNLSATPPAGNHPRYPLILAEIDQESGLLKKNTVMALDDRRPGQGAEMQFSNFSFFEDRETHHLEILLTAYGEGDGEDWRTANCYKYTVKLL